MRKINSKCRKEERGSIPIDKRPMRETDQFSIDSMHWINIPRNEKIDAPRKEENRTLSDQSRMDAMTVVTNKAARART